MRPSGGGPEILQAAPLSLEERRAMMALAPLAVQSGKLVSLTLSGAV